MHLLSFNKDRINITNLRCSNAEFSFASTATRSRNGRWEPVVGVACTYGQTADVAKLHVASQLSEGFFESVKTTALSFEEQLSLVPGSWMKMLSREKSSFSEIHDLKGKVAARLAGLASSITGHYVASCFSIHPSGLLEYVMQKHQISTFIIKNEFEDMLATGIQDVPGCICLKGIDYQACP